MCLGIASDKAGPGENWLSSQNRNFENRMGQGSIAWLASAPTVAASSIDMRITDPRPFLDELSPMEFASYLKAPGLPPEIHLSEPSDAAGEAQSAAAVPAAMANGLIQGHAQLFGNHVDTDAMIPGEFCHLTEPAAIAEAAFRYARPDFRARIARGEDICIAGEGWGSGSSREHAAWALKYAGVKAVIAKSVAYIHKRNLVNEAIPFFLVHDEAFHAAVHDGDPISIDASSGVVHLGPREFHADPVSPIALKIQSAGGVVPAVQREGKAAFAV
jgi:aconitate hydratase/homoaconitate hydratase